MTLLTADLLVQCPKTRSKVNVNQQCQGNPKCQHFKHISYVGSKVYIVCSYGETEKKENIL